MSAINSSTLFHFTKKYADFRRIVQKGLITIMPPKSLSTRKTNW